MKTSFLVLDIGTEAVKVLDSSGKENLAYFDETSVWHSQYYFQDVFSKTIERALKGADGKVFLQLPLNFFKARVVSKTILREGKKEISLQEEKDFYEKFLADCRNTIRAKNFEETGILPGELSFIKESIIQRKVDGYEVPRLAGYNGREIFLKAFFTFIPKTESDKFQRIISGLNLKIAGIRHQTEGLMLADLAEEAIFLDIGGSLTQAILVKQGLIESIREFNIGGEDFSRSISEVLGLGSLRGRIFKENYSRGKLSKPVFSVVKEIVKKKMNSWKAELPAFSPAKVFVFGGGSLLPDFYEAIKGFYPRAKIIREKNPQYFSASLILKSALNE